MVKKAAKFIVKGTVQGIFFRQFVKGHADNLKLRGFVRNLTGGDVEIIVEGEMGAIERLAGFVRKGPEHSQIRGVQIEERKWSGDFKEFKILRF
ncbi:acylphosphatase [Candidatus Pacearchaeota archaeon]|nr:acylphosphatase [Candidatus Pacearchaeota archaeon]